MNSLQVLKEMTDNLLSQEEEIELVLAQASLLFAVATPDERLTRLSNSWEMLLGYSKDEISSRKFWDFLHPDDLQKTRQAWADRNAGVPLHCFINRLIAKDGTAKYIYWRGRAKTTKGYTYSIAIDVTDLKGML